MSIGSVQGNPYIPPIADNGEPTARDKNENFKEDLRVDATKLSQVELEGFKKLALIDSAVGSIINTTA